MSITEFQSVADIGEQFGNPRSTIPGNGGHVSRWWRLHEAYLHPSLKFCPDCVESALWSRNCCASCGGDLHPMTMENKRQLDEKKAKLTQGGVVEGLLTILVRAVQQDA